MLKPKYQAFEPYVKGRPQSKENSGVPKVITININHGIIVHTPWGLVTVLIAVTKYITEKNGRRVCCTLCLSWLGRPAGQSSSSWSYRNGKSMLYLSP